MAAAWKEIVHLPIRAPDVAHDVARLGARSDLLHQNALEFLPELRVVDICVKRRLTGWTPAQRAQPLLRQDDDMLARLAGRAFVAVLDDIPAERLDHLGKQQDLGGKRAEEIILMRNRVAHAQYMEFVAHIRGGSKRMEMTRVPAAAFRHRGSIRLIRKSVADKMETMFPINNTQMLVQER